MSVATMAEARVSTDSLEQGIAALGLTLSATQRDQLNGHLDLIEKWNKVHNLTAIRGRANMVTQHLLDSLVILPHVLPQVRGARLLDVGSGAGLPGIPLAIARPDLAVTLLDSSQKRIAFVQQAVATLGLKNVECVAARVEEFRPATNFDVIVSRAFADLGEFVAMSRHLLAPSGELLAMKGLHPSDELQRVPDDITVSAVHRLIVPGLAADRHLIVLRNAPNDKVIDV